MAQKTESATKQSELVSEILSSTLAAARSGSPAAQAKAALGLLAEADSCLSQAANAEGRAFDKLVEKANTLLKDALVQLRAHPPSEPIAESVARCLALLYPVAPSPEDRPLTLSKRPPKLPSLVPLPGGAERRRAPRVVLNTDVSFESETNFYTGFTEDLSDGGLFFATYALKPIGETIEISFTLPDGHIVNAKGKVRWVRDPRDDSSDVAPGMGIQFEDLSSEDRNAILEFLKARAPMFYDE